MTAVPAALAAETGSPDTYPAAACASGIDAVVAYVFAIESAYLRRARPPRPRARRARRAAPQEERAEEPVGAAQHGQDRDPGAVAGDERRRVELAAVPGGARAS